MKNINSIDKSRSSRNFWRKRPSEIKGYNRTLYTTTGNNEYLRVDFNSKERRVRLYIEDNEEGGNPYYSVITNGKITIERNATTGRTADLHDKFSKRSAVFSSIPNKEVIGLINRNYGIGTDEGKFSLNKERRIRQQQVRQQNSTASDSVVEEERDTEAREKTKENKFVDVADTVVGLILCIALYALNHSFVTLGVLSAFIGIFMGLLDVYYRERRLILIKMLFFLLSGIVSYIYGYYIL